MPVDRGGRSPRDATGNSLRLRLRFAGREVDVTRGTLVIGRDSGCEVVIDDTVASRRHAQIMTDANGSTVADLGSANGTWVNGQRIMAPRLLVAGDWLTVGRLEMQLIDVGTSKTIEMRAVSEHPPALGTSAGSTTATRARPTSAPPELTRPQGRPSPTPPTPEASFRLPRQRSTPTAGTARVSEPPIVIREPAAAPPAPVGADALPDITGRANAFDIFGQLADKALAAREDDRAEQLLSAQFRGILETARQRGALTPDVTDFVVRYAIKLASATRKSSGVDMLFKIFTIIRKPVPLGTIDELETLLRRLPTFDRAALHDYAEVLRVSSDTLGTGDKLLARRVIALDQAVAARR